MITRPGTSVVPSGVPSGSTADSISVLLSVLAFIRASSSSRPFVPEISFFGSRAIKGDVTSEL